MDISSIASIGGGVLSAVTGGGLFGVIGGLFQKGLDAWHEAKQAETNLLLLKEKNAHELLMRDKDHEMLVLEAQNGLALAGLNMTRDVDVASYAAMGKSYDSDKATFATGAEASNSRLFIWVDFIRGMTRPVLTSYMAILFTAIMVYVTYQVFNYVPALMTDVAFLKSAFLELVDATIFMTTTVILWWFAARGIKSK